MYNSVPNYFLRPLLRPSLHDGSLLCFCAASGHFVSFGWGGLNCRAYTASWLYQHVNTSELVAVTRDP